MRRCMARLPGAPEAKTIELDGERFAVDEPSGREAGEEVDRNFIIRGWRLFRAPS